MADRSLRDVDHRRLGDPPLRPLAGPVEILSDDLPVPTLAREIESERRANVRFRARGVAELVLHDAAPLEPRRFEARVPRV